VNWIDNFMDAVQSKDVDLMLTILQGQSTEHAGTPNQAIKNQAIKSIKKCLDGCHRDIYEIAVRLANSNNAIGEEIGAILIAEQYHIHPLEITETLKKLADNPNWEVREWAASACGMILSKNFSSFYPVMMDWTRDSSPNIRRAAAVAAKYTGKLRNPDFSESLLDLVEQLLDDTDPYVKKNLGAFCLGDGLLRYYPEQVRSRIEKWIMIDNEQVRWNMAKIFSSAEGVKQIEDYQEVLDILLSDPRLSIKRAMKSIMNALEKRRPEIYSKYFQE
jgi:hypothetical protein